MAEEEQAKAKALAEQDTVGAVSAVSKEYVEGEGGKTQGKHDRKGTTEKLDNIYGSTAGASSSTFHVYRNHRRKEMFRVTKMEKDHKDAVLNDAFQRKREKNEVEAKERTSKNAEKRKRKKMRQKMARERMKQQKRAAEEPAQDIS